MAIRAYAISAFNGSAIFHGALGISLFALVVLRAGRARKVLLAIVGVLGLFAFLPLLDAAFSSHGVKAVMLFPCAGGDFVVAILTLTAAFVRGGNLAKGEPR